MKAYSYTVVLEPEQDPRFRGYYTAYVPALPGCVSYGKTRAEAVKNIKEAILGYLEALRKEKRPIPTNSRADVRHVKVAV